MNSDDEVASKRKPRKARQKEKAAGDLCLICCSQNCKEFISENNGAATTAVISKQLNVIFILRNLLEVPSSQLAENLKHYGGPENWIINICEKCTQLIVQARKLHFRIVENSKQLKLIQKQILDNIKRSDQTPGGNVNSRDLKQKAKKRGRPKKNVERKVIWNQTRTFVRQHNYGDLEDPFCDGDNLAETKALQENQAVKSDPECLLSGDLLLDVKEEPKINFTSSSPVEDNYHDDDPDWFPDDTPEISSPNVDVASSPQTVISADKQNSVKKKKKVNHPHPTIRYKCTVPGCPEKFYFASRLFKHLCSVHSITEVPCLAGCENRNFRTVTEFLRHRADHRKGLEVKCIECSKEFTSRRGLVVHLRNKHLATSEPGPFICEICGKELTSAFGLRKHKRYIHGVGKDASTTFIPTEGMKPHLCVLCGASLKNKDCLMHHKRRVHEKKFLHNCHLCGHKMFSPSELNLHLLRMHKEEAGEYLQTNGIQLFKCPVSRCRMSFLKKQTYEKHMTKIHGVGADGGEGSSGGGGDTGKFRYSCSFCGRGFFHAQKVKKHEELHTNEGITIEKCYVCGKVFNRKLHLGNHLRNVHKIAKKYNNVGTGSINAEIKTVSST